MTITEAARLLRVSRRTVQRRVKSGALSGVKHEGRWLVDIPTDVDIERHTPDTDALLSQVDALTRERDQLEQRVEDLSHDKTYLEQALAVSLSNQQKLLASGATPARPGLWQRVKRWFAGETEGGG